MLVQESYEPVRLVGKNNMDEVNRQNKANNEIQTAQDKKQRIPDPVFRNRVQQTYRYWHQKNTNDDYRYEIDIAK